MLEARVLRVVFEPGTVAVLDGVSLRVGAGEVVGIAGESGCGKSLLGASLPRLLPEGARIAAGEVRFQGRDVGAMDEAALRALRGPGIATVFQDPVAHLHPAMRIGAQIMAALRAHHPEMGSGGLRARVLAALAAARMPDPEAAAQAWPHQLSGGLAQRALIAMALAQAPALLIADEPTTALDPPVAAAILDLLHARARQDGMALLLISHDLDQLAARADRLAVMYAGRIVEEAPTELLFADPQHPYTLGLLASMPRPGPPEPFASIPGTVPRPGAWPSGCRFRTRCPFAVADCASVDPALREVAAGHFAACIRAPL